MAERVLTVKAFIAAVMAALLTSGCFFHDIDEIAQEAVNESMDEMRASQSASAAPVALQPSGLELALPKGSTKGDAGEAVDWVEEDWEISAEYPVLEKIDAKLVSKGWSRCTDLKDSYEEIIPGTGEGWSDGEDTVYVRVYDADGGATASIRALWVTGHRPCETGHPLNGTERSFATG